jgi:hypothetical protein
MGLLRFVPTGLLTRVAIYGLVFLLGAAVGNSRATKQALQDEAHASANRMRENHLVLFDEFKKRNAEYKAHIEQQQGASNAAYEQMQSAKARSDRSLAVARAQIAKLTETKLDVPIPGPTPGCVLPPSVRQSLNAAIDSLNNRPDVGFAEAPPTRLPDGTSAGVAPLTCGELVGSVTDILEHDAMLTAWVLSWQRWAYEALR